MKSFGSSFIPIILLFFALILFVSPTHADKLTIAAANSTCKSIKLVGALYEKRYNTRLNYICKSSGLLAKGILGKAINADVYISANKSWMDKIVKRNVSDQKDVSSLWGNSLVIVSAKDNLLKLDDWMDLKSDKVKKIMIGDPGTAPFGRHTKQALKTTMIWASVKDKIETKKHITLLADAMVNSEHGTVGILFKTNLNDDLIIIYRVDSSWHKPIRYYSTPIKGSANFTGAQSFIEFLKADEAQQVFRIAGFELFDS